MSGLYTILVYVKQSDGTEKVEWLDSGLATFSQEAADMASRYTESYGKIGRRYQAYSLHQAKEIMGDA